MPGAGSRGWELLLAAGLGTLAGGLIAKAGASAGWVAASPAAEGLCAAVLLWLYPEKDGRRWSLGLVAVLLLSAGLLFAFWVAVFAWGRTQFTEIGDYERALLVATLVKFTIAAPIFEEKIVRDLLLRGLADMMPVAVAVVLVSAAFALAHMTTMVWAFIVSVVLSIMAIKWRVSTLQRATVHGVINLLVLLWYTTRGYGFFSQDA